MQSMKIIKRNKTLYTITMTVVMTNMNNIRKQPKTQFAQLNITYRSVYTYRN